MKIMRTIMVVALSAILFSACTKETEVTTGSVIITIDNRNLFNQSDYFVEAGIVFLESDSGLLEDLGRSDISEGGKVEFNPIELNLGNYYVRYQYYLGNSLSGSEQHKPFQIRAGEEVVVTIIR